eukprot:Partr_v1_DN24527_c1_g1_i3_m19857 putative small nuclear ribonucleoprotein
MDVDNKIPAIENLGITRDQNDTLDLTNNDIRRVENFPLMLRVQHLLLANNRITFIDRSTGAFLPNLTAIILDNNQLSQLGDIKGLADFPKLEYLSLLDNPVTQHVHYRLFVIYQCPRLRMLDFTRIRQSERDEAERLFSGAQGEALHAEMADKAGAFDVGDVAARGASGGKASGLSASEIARIQEAIQNAKSLDEVARLERQLRSGYIPESS